MIIAEMPCALRVPADGWLGYKQVDTTKATHYTRAAVRLGLVLDFCSASQSKIRVAIDNHRLSTARTEFSPEEIVPSMWLGCFSRDDADRERSVGAACSVDCVVRQRAQCI